MGHDCRIIHFNPNTCQDSIQQYCYDWQRAHADLEECGYDGPRLSVSWTKKQFQTKDEADEYLEDTFGGYDQTAVQYKDEDGQLCWAVACEVHC